MTELSPLIRALAGQDPDFARKANGVGFDRTDGGRGHQLAAIPETEWTTGDRQYAEYLATKYRGQLASYGFTVPKFARKRCDQPRAMRVIDGRTVLTFGYDARLVETLKRSVRARWDAQNKWWVVQPGSEAYAAKFAADNGFEVTETATAAVAAAPKPEPLKIAVTTEGGRIVVVAPFEYKDRLKAIPGSRWDPDARAWTFPESSAVAQALAWVIGDQPGLSPYVAQIRAADEAQALRDADDLPEIPGLAGTSWRHQRQAYWFCMRLFGYDVTESHSKDASCSQKSPAPDAEPSSPHKPSPASHDATAHSDAGSRYTTTPNGTPSLLAPQSSNAPTSYETEGEGRPTESAPDGMSTESSPSSYSGANSQPMTSSTTRTVTGGTMIPATSNSPTESSTRAITSLSGGGGRSAQKHGQRSAQLSAAEPQRREVMPNQSPSHGGGVMLAMAMGTG